MTVGDQQGLSDQRVEQIKRCIVVVEYRYCTGTFELESTGEHRTPVQQRFLRIVEQIVRPCHRMAQRLVAFQAPPCADQ